MSVFNGQTLLKLSLDTEYDLSVISQVNIIYRKPSGTVGSWTGAKNGTHIDFKEFTQSTLDETGTWKFQAEVITADGKVARGEITELSIEEKL